MTLNINYITQQLEELASNALTDNIETKEISLVLKFPVQLYNIALHVAENSNSAVEETLSKMASISLKNEISKIKENMIPKNDNLLDLTSLFQVKKQPVTNNQNNNTKDIFAQINQLESVLVQFSKLAETLKQVEVKEKANEKK